MDFAARYVELTHWIVGRFGADKLVHVNAGLLIWTLTIIALRTRPSAITPLSVVAGIESFNEAMDRLGDHGWTVIDTLEDIVATLVWPMLLALLSSRFSHGEDSAENARARLQPENENL